MSHQLTKRVRVGDLSAEDRAKYGLTDYSENEMANIVVGNIVKDPPAVDPVTEVKLQPGERVEPI